MNAKRLLISFLLAAVAGWLMPAGAQPLAKYIFTHFKKSNGLASNKVFQVVQDKQGYMWIGTDNGLQRYDGYRFTTFRNIPGDSLSLPDDLIALLFIDKKGRLWVNSGKKTGIFDPRTNRFTDVPIRLMTIDINKGIRKFIPNKDGRVMIFVAKKLVTFDERKMEFSEEHNFIKPPSGWYCEDLFQDPATGLYWITGKSGLMMFDAKKSRFAYRDHNPDSNKIISQYAQLEFTQRPFMDHKGRFWMAQGIPFRGAAELHCFDTKTGVATVFKDQVGLLSKGYFEIWGMAEQHDGDLLVYGYNLFLRFNNLTGKFNTVRDETLNEYTINYDYITLIYRDREENLWACTNLGLFLFNPKTQPFKSVIHLRPGDSVGAKMATTGIFLNANKELWMSTWGRGVYSYDLNFNPIPNPLQDSNPEYRNLLVWCMNQRRNAEVWIGSSHGRILVYEPGTKKLTDYKPAAMEGGTVRDIFEDKQSNIWIGTELGHVLRYRKGAWADTSGAFETVHKMQGRVLRFFERKDGSLWFTTDLYGLYQIDPVNGKILQHIDEKKGLGKQVNNATITDMLDYNDSTMLIASNTINVLNTKSGKIGNISTADGLPSNQAINLIRDGAGYIWVTLGNGLSRFNYEKKIFSSYDVRDGIMSDNFEMNANLLLPDGRLIMGTNHDFLVFNPNEVNRLNDLPTDVMITGFRLQGKSLSVDSLTSVGTIELGYNDNSITIDYSAMRFLRQNKIVYYHMLEGADKEWVRSENQQALYTYLPPGNYTFKVKSVNGNGKESRVTTIEMHIDRPFWTSWWFYAALLLTAALFFYYIDRERVKRLLSLQRVRTQIAGDLHSEIHSTLNNIHLLSELTKMKVDKDLVRSREYINQISDKSKRMIVAMDDILWSIEPENDSMQMMLLRMREYTEALKDHHGSTINFKVEDKVGSVKLDMNIRHQFLLVFKESLRSVVELKHGLNTEIHLDVVKSRLMLKVQDLTVTELSNPELELCFEDMKRRSAAIRGSLDIHSETNRISIILSVPLISPSTS